MIGYAPLPVAVIDAKPIAIPRPKSAFASVSRTPTVAASASARRSRKTRMSMRRARMYAPTRTKLVMRSSRIITAHEYARVAAAKTAPQTPKPTVAMSPTCTPGIGRPSVARTWRESVDVRITPANTTCPAERRSPRKMTARGTVTATYDATTGATTAIGPSARAR